MPILSNHNIIIIAMKEGGNRLTQIFLYLKEDLELRTSSFFEVC